MEIQMIKLTKKIRITKMKRKMPIKLMLLLLQKPIILLEGINRDEILIGGFLYHLSPKIKEDQIIWFRKFQNSENKKRN